MTAWMTPGPGKKYWSDGTPVAGQQFQYGFDDVGNGTTTAAGGDQWGANLRYAAYAVNNLNQYTSRSVPGAVDVIGTGTNTATVTVNNIQAYRKGNYYRAALPLANGAGPVWQAVTNLAVLNNGTNADILTNVTGNVFLPQTPENFTYDADGNLTQDGRWQYTWDAENRLVSVQAISGVPTAAKLKLDFLYDYKGRRCQKLVSTNNGSSYYPFSTNRFVYDDWNLVCELGATNNSVLRAYTWGLDLSGSAQGAGGVGGLLGANDATNGSQFVALDGNGDVAALTKASDATVSAQYEYGPFGELLRATGPMAKASPFRFSTKYQDDETDLVYYGYRYYNARTGGWLSRDPIEEQGFDSLQNVDTPGDTSGANLYNFVANNPLSGIDLFGLRLGDMPGEHPVPPYNPSPAGRKCCCQPPGPAHITGTRSDPPPTETGNLIFYSTWTLHLRVQVNSDSDCYTDVRVDWVRCWGPGGAGYMGSGTRIDNQVRTGNYIGRHPWWMTEARINYLTCENGVWTKKLAKASITYVWNGSDWEFNYNGGQQCSAPGS